MGKQIYKIAEHKITMDFPQQIEGMRFNNAEIVKFRGGVFGGFSDWCWYSGFGGSVVRTPLLHSDVMRLRRSVQLVLILITCKKTKIHKMDIQKTHIFFKFLLYR